MKVWDICLAAALLLVPMELSSALQAAPNGRVALVRVPNGGIQPKVVVDANGVLHMIYFAGEPRGGDIFYVRSRDYGRRFSAPVRVNSGEGSAIATGTIRGAQLALGRGGRIHVAWNGSELAAPRGMVEPHSGQAGAPMLYARLTDDGKAFEPQRNLMQRTYGLDGGGSIAADVNGNVYVGWHGTGAGTATTGEAGRQVWLARSEDEGQTFGAEEPAWNEPTGTCACCGMRLFADSRARVYGLYRSATNLVHRDIYLLVSPDKRGSFRGRRLHEWEIGACPMTSMAFAEGPRGVLATWETEGQVYFATIDASAPAASTSVSPPGAPRNRKHPRLAINDRGEALLLWTEGTAWARGGAAAWRLFDAAGQPARPERLGRRRARVELCCRRRTSGWWIHHLLLTLGHPPLRGSKLLAGAHHCRRPADACSRAIIETCSPPTDPSGGRASPAPSA